MVSSCCAQAVKPNRHPPRKTTKTTKIRKRRPIFTYIQSELSKFHTQKSSFLTEFLAFITRLKAGPENKTAWRFLFQNQRVTLRKVSDTLVINEIYLSLQGESTYAGLPCIFVRLTACDLRCSYCDTAYAFTDGKKMLLSDILTKVRQLAAPFSNFQPSTCDSQLPLVELTGGEPLLQKNSLPMMKSLCDDGFTVLLETSGAHDISQVDPRVHRIMDLKCPSSGEAERNRWENLKYLKATDEIKFVIGTQEDYAWTKQQIAGQKLDSLCPLLISWVHPLSPPQQDKSLKEVPAGQTTISRRELAEKIVADALPVRFQVQMHKVIWPPEQRGV
jgi:7-carboxy-7-deazaguanine synthase